jgi:carbonic anhydrase/acetyltransferase-like protein (isoleucine patch superfamily)
VTIGHSANVHGCEIGDGTLVGIGATILNHAKVGKNCMIGANTLISEGKEIPDNSLVVGSPGKVVRDVTPEILAGMIANNEFYQGNGKRFRSELKSDPRN